MQRKAVAVDGDKADAVRDDDEHTDQLPSEAYDNRTKSVIEQVRTDESSKATSKKECRMLADHILVLRTVQDIAPSPNIPHAINHVTPHVQQYKTKPTTPL